MGVNIFNHLTSEPQRSHFLQFGKFLQELLRNSDSIPIVSINSNFEIFPPIIRDAPNILHLNGDGVKTDDILHAIVEDSGFTPFLNEMINAANQVTEERQAKA